MGMMIAPRATTTTAVTMATTTDGGISHLILTPFKVPWHRPSVPLSPLSARLDVFFFICCELAVSSARKDAVVIDGPPLLPLSKEECVCSPPLVCMIDVH